MVSRSYTCGCGDESALYVTIPDRLDHCAEEHPDKEAYVFWSTHTESRLLRQSITYRDLAERSRIVAAALLDLELNVGDRLVILAGDCPEWIILEYAALRCKLLLIRISPNNVTARSLMETIVKYKCKAVVVDGRRGDKISQLVCNMFLRKHGHSPDKRKCGRVIGLKRDDGSRILTIHDLAESDVGSLGRVSEIQDSIEADDVAVVLTSSASGDETKLFRFSHFAVINSCRSLRGAISVDKSATYYDYSSFCDNGYSHFIGAAFGITCIHLDHTSSEDMDHMTTVVSEEKVTIAVVSGRFLDRVHRKWVAGVRDALPSCLRYVIVRGSYVTNDDAATLYPYQRRQQTVVSLYATEYTLITAAAVAGVHRSYKDGSPEYRAVAGVQMKVVNSNGVVLPVEHPGTLMVKSPYACCGYLDEGGEHDDVISWYDTGDVASMSQDGGIRIIDRSDDIIRHGSLKIYPSVVEKQLRSLPEVINAVVIGFPSKATQQDVCACVSVASGSKLSVEYFTQLCEGLKVNGELDCAIKYVKIIEEDSLTTVDGQLSVDSCKCTAVDKQLIRSKLLSLLMEDLNRIKCKDGEG